MNAKKLNHLKNWKRLIFKTNEIWKNQKENRKNEKLSKTQKMITLRK